jgi:predicted MPP superfamily phosphohydrolase
MKKIIVIGDIHGRSSWKLINKNNVDKIIFLGDYFDPYENISTINLIKNFNEIIKYKEQFPDKVICLLGNHDSHYLLRDEEYSRYNRYGANKYNKLLNHNIKNGNLIRAYSIDNFLFTHAGVSKTWYNRFFDTDLSKETLEIIVNNINSTDLNNFRFSIYPTYDPYGDTVTQSPFWIRPNSLLKDSKDLSFIQVVGHTQVTHPTQIENVILADSLGSNLYLCLNDGVVEENII